MTGHWTKSLTPEEVSRRMSETARANKGKSPWRCGPICKSRKAQEKFMADHVNIDTRVAGLVVVSRIKR